MPTINKLPIGGGASSGGTAGLNIYTQLNEPEKKDGIWIKTNNQYDKIIVDNQHLANSSGSGVWSKSIFSLPRQGRGYTDCMYNGNLHVFSSQYHYVYDDITNTYTQLSDENTYTDGTTRKHIVFNGILYGLLAGKTGNDAYTDTHMTKYDARNDKWSNIYPPKGTSRDNGSTAAVLNNTLYMHISDDLYKMSTDDAFTLMNRRIETSNSAVSFVSNNGRIDIFVNEANDYPKYHKYIENDHLYDLNDPPSYVNHAVLYNGIIHLLSGDSSNNYPHYIYNKSSDTYTKIGNLPNYIDSVYTKDNYLAGIGEKYISGQFICYLYKYTTPENVYDPQTLIIQKGYTNGGKYVTNITDTSVIEGDGLNNRFPSGFDDCYYFADSAFDWNAPMYYGNGSQWIKFKN